MIRGILIKDGETTELWTNGMEEITPEIHIIPMVARKRKPRRRVDSFSIPNAIFMGIAIGMPAGLMVMEMVLGDGPIRIWAGLAMGIGAFWLWQNFWRKR